MTTYQAVKDCPDCDGEGHYPRNEDHPHAVLSPVFMYEAPPCDDCGGDGIGSDCEHCDDDGDLNGPGEPFLSCGHCDGTGHFACDACDGNGCLPADCSYCHEEIEGRGYFDVACYIGEGELICEDCADYTCETCKGEGRVSHDAVDDNGTERRTVAGSCSCCGASPRSKDDGKPCQGPGGPYDWYVYETRLVDSDGIYMARLCGDVDGDGCLSDVERSRPGRHEREKVIAGLLGDDTDGAQALIEDLS